MLHWRSPCSRKRGSARGTRGSYKVQSLTGGPAAVDEKRFAGDQRGCGRGEKDHGASHFHGLADAVEGGDAVNGVGQMAQVGEILFRAWRANKSGGDGVHADSMFAPFDSQAFRQMSDAGFGHAVNRFGGKCSESRLRAHVDNGAFLLLDHYATRGLAGEKRSY